MDRVQQSKRNMYLVVEEYIKKVDPAIRAAMPNFDTTFQEFQDGLANIRTASENQLINRTGYKIEKDNYQQEMATQCVIISARLQAYALNTHDLQLFQAVKHKRNAIIKLRDGSCIDYCQHVHDQAQEHLQNLAPYGVTQQDLNTFQAAIKKFLKWQPKTRSAIVNKRMSTRALAESIALCATKLKAMDIYVKMLQTSHPEFYETYTGCRKLITPSYRKIALRGQITNEEGMPIHNAVITINTLRKTTKTTHLGRFEIKTIPPGVYKVTIQHPSHQTQTIKVAITANQRTDITTKLPPGIPMRMAS